MDGDTLWKGEYLTYVGGNLRTAATPLAEERLEEVFSMFPPPDVTQGRSFRWVKRGGDKWYELLITANPEFMYVGFGRIVESGERQGMRVSDGFSRIYYHHLGRGPKSVYASATLREFGFVLRGSEGSA